MTELSNNYPKELFHSALAEIERIDTTWRIEAEALKVQYAAATARRDEAQGDMDRLEAASHERSNQSQKLRSKLAQSAFALVANTDGLIQERSQAIELGVQLETGQWINDREVELLTRSVEHLDAAVEANDPILHFLDGKLEYALKPQAEARQLLVDSSDRGSRDYHYLDFKIPYDTYIGHERSYRHFSDTGTVKKSPITRRDGELTIKNDLLEIKREYRTGKKDATITHYTNATITREGYEPHEKDQAYVIGSEAIQKTIKRLITPPRAYAIVDERDHDAAFEIWRVAASVSRGMEVFDEAFKDTTADTLVEYLKQGSFDNDDAYISGLVRSVKRLGIEDTVADRAHHGICETGTRTLFYDRTVFDAAYNHFIQLHSERND